MRFLFLQIETKFSINITDPKQLIMTPNILLAIEENDLRYYENPYHKTMILGFALHTITVYHNSRQMK